MSLAVRVIPCLDVAVGRVVKGLKFENLRDAGDPVEAARRYEAEGADELCFLDVAASHEGRGTLVDLVRRVADVLSIPFTVGGGVRSVEDAGALLDAGADRVTVNTAAVLDPSLVTRLAERFGAQCVVVAVDAKKDGGRSVVSTHGGRKVTEIELGAWVAEVTARGAGEILLTSMDADGTKAGFDLPMLKAARAVATLPIVASGGAGEPGHFAPAVLEGGADAVLAASVFHDRIFSVGMVKRAMAKAGVPVRPAIPAGLEEVAFDGRGLVPVVVRDATTGEVLTLAWANDEALALTVETRQTHLFSRSRKALWKKGETSGNVQRVVGVSLDCDRDAVLYDVEPAGPACHTGAATCFAPIDAIPAGHAPAATRESADPFGLGPLFDVVAARKASPEPGSYTNRLLEKGIGKCAQKVGEEGVEVALAAVSRDDAGLAAEMADLMYHVVVLMAARGLEPSAVAAELAARRGARREEK
ncbi:MAG TPA: imidazole glycerol phosphate synthase subunit HisF [Thermoanaerobaculia bacterium]|jgi:cyclase|nr:imidazole glycerol phosphate synthase subunit HisF [Thermoanaerobaculia bacterium]HQN08645.1 imidazole glycerol phosphate synthase subunit HisF [Thermoanaerobaculia bacterium]HQP87504.1 imidazole glycerol phosphate synthase subunit HisF [Thermoanaerobaculia bacterium]